MLDEQLTTEALGVLLDAATDPDRGESGRSWRLEVNGHLLDVYVDGSHPLPTADPAARGLRIAAGVAVFDLRCAAASLSFDSWFSLCPYRHDPDLLARIVIEPTGLPDQELRQLYRAIRSRHLTRPPAGPDNAVQLALARAAELENTKLGWLSVSFAPLAVLSTDRDERSDQVAAGIALERILLTSIRHDVAATHLPQPIRRPELRRCAQELTGTSGFAQTLIRFGRAPAGDQL
ncbi:hypothetical protein AB0I34_40510 [Kribbella sp. NPDC050281]|uniref:hypothetical protein n=1 Tax=Kribbella sp. NPDC050281 TaxID=3155515 RepID=UPI0033C91383